MHCTSVDDFSRESAFSRNLDVPDLVFGAAVVVGDVNSQQFLKEFEVEPSFHFRRKFGFQLAIGQTVRRTLQREGPELGHDVVIPRHGVRIGIVPDLSIRKSGFAQSEPGGFRQHIGEYERARNGGIEIREVARLFQGRRPVVPSSGGQVQVLIVAQRHRAKERIDLLIGVGSRHRGWCYGVLQHIHERSLQAAIRGTRLDAGLYTQNVSSRHGFQRKLITQGLIGRKRSLVIILVVQQGSFGIATHKKSLSRPYLIQVTEIIRKHPDVGREPVSQLVSKPGIAIVAVIVVGIVVFVLVPVGILSERWLLNVPGRPVPRLLGSIIVFIITQVRIFDLALTVHDVKQHRIVAHEACSWSSFGMVVHVVDAATEREFVGKFVGGVQAYEEPS